MPVVHQLPVVGWRAWYTDNRIWDSAHTKWEDLPPRGIIAIMLYCDPRPYRQIMTSATCYWRDADGGFHSWGWADEDPADAPIHHEDIQAGRLKIGVWVSDAEMARVSHEAWEAHIAPDESLRRDKR